MKYFTRITPFWLLFFLASCSEEMIETATTNPEWVSFMPQWKAIGESTTRGTPLTNASQLTNMGAFAYYTGRRTWETEKSTATSAYMHNQEVTQKLGVWSYSPVRYWLLGNTTFFAYAPYAAAKNGITVQPSYVGAPTIEYTAPRVCEDQPDLMVAVRQENKSDEQIALPMKHALASIGFTVEASSVPIKISKISVKGISVSGTLSLNLGNRETPAWSNLGAPTSTEYTSGVKSNFTAGTTAIGATTPDGYLMMIPQTLGADAKLTVTVKGEEREVSLAGKVWEAGEKYTYMLKIEYDPIVIGLFGGWDGIKRKYTSLLEVERRTAAQEAADSLMWATSEFRPTASSKHYGLVNINKLKETSRDLSRFPAARYCEQKGEGWYLPSQAQLVAIWIAYGGIATEFLPVLDHYWSSNPSGVVSAKTANLGNGYWTHLPQRTRLRVRCVRDYK